MTVLDIAIMTAMNRGVIWSLFSPKEGGFPFSDLVASTCSERNLSQPSTWLAMLRYPTDHGCYCILVVTSLDQPEIRHSLFSRSC